MQGQWKSGPASSKEPDRFICPRGIGYPCLGLTWKVSVVLQIATGILQRVADIVLGFAGLALGVGMLTALTMGALRR